MYTETRHAMLGFKGHLEEDGPGGGCWWLQGEHAPGPPNVHVLNTC